MLLHKAITGDPLLDHLVEAISIRHGHSVKYIMGEVRRFSWPADDRLDQREALIRFMAGRLMAPVRAGRQDGP
jgi:hypothetical protein